MTTEIHWSLLTYEPDFSTPPQRAARVLDIYEAYKVDSGLYDSSKPEYHLTASPDEVITDLVTDLLLLAEGLVEPGMGQGVGELALMHYDDTLSGESAMANGYAWITEEAPA